MACIKIKKPDGNFDSRFGDLVNLFQGDENKALDEYVRTYILGEHSIDFMLVDSQNQNAKDFLESSFSFNDRFTDADARTIKSMKHQYVTKVSEYGVIKYQMFDHTGELVKFDIKELDSRIDAFVEGRKKTDRELMHNLTALLKDPSFEKPFEFAKSLTRLFRKVSTDVVYGFFGGLSRNNIQAYAELEGKPYFLSSLRDENILVGEKKVGENSNYTILIPSLKSKDYSRPGKNVNSFAREAFGEDNMLARKKGFSINDNNEGRKLLEASIVAMAIKASDPNARITDMRFGDFSGEGKVTSMDLYQGMKNLRALYSNPETKQSLPPDVLDVIEKTMEIPEHQFLPDAVEILKDSEVRKRENQKGYNKYLLKVFESGHQMRMLEAVNERIYELVRYNQTKGPNGLRPYEDVESPVGQEMVLLSKSREQLAQYGGIDKRVMNTEKKLHGFASWIKSLGDFQNAHLNLVFNDFKSAAFKYKQDFVKFMKPKNESVKKFMNAYEKHNGITAKSRVMNYTQHAYNNLYDTIEVRELKNGKITDVKKKVDVMRFKDPNDMTNGLLEFERVFIRETIDFHRKSIVRFINKKIDNGEIDGVAYKDGDAWYEQEYKAVELNLPVMKKKSSTLVAEGSLKDSVDSMLQEATDFLELSPNDLERDRKYRPFGSASNQKGSIYGSTGRLSALGLTMHNGEIVLESEKKNGQVNHDVEQILHSSVFQNFKYELEPTLVSAYTAAKILLMQEQLQGKDRSNEINTLSALFDNLVYNERVNITQDNWNPEKILDGSRKVIGTATLMVNFSSAMLATFGNFAAFTSNALAGRFGKHYFTMKNAMAAIKFASTDPKKFSDIVDMFLFHDKNESALVFSSKYKEGERGWLKDHHKMIMHHLGDRLTRGLVIVAQLHHEGILDNFEFTKEGQLFYNWDKDKRKDPIKEHIRERNKFQEKDDLPFDDHMINTMNSISAKMYGAYQDEEKNRVQTHALAQWAGQFKGYILARMNEAVQSGFDNTNISWYELAENGTVRSTVYYQEGILNTVAQYYKEIKKLDQSPITVFKNMKPEQKDNLRKMTADLTFLVATFLLYAIAIPEDDEDRKKVLGSSEFNTLKYAWMDIGGIYNALDYMDAVTPSSISFGKRLVTALGNFITLDIEKGAKQTFVMTGFGKTTRDFTNMLDRIAD